jgi:hypothetical protein
MRRKIGGRHVVSYPLREVHLDAEDSNILRTRTLGLRVKDGGDGGRGEGRRGCFDGH